MTQKIGLYTIIDVRGMAVVTYAFHTYELALAQAHENETGVTEPVERMSEVRAVNGMRQTTWKYSTLHELGIVQEVEVATAILPVANTEGTDGHT